MQSMRRSSREIPARVCQPENPFGQARQPDHLANPPPHLRPRRRGGNAFTRYGHGGAWGTQAWIDRVKGVAYVLTVPGLQLPQQRRQRRPPRISESSRDRVGQWQGHAEIDALASVIKSSALGEVARSAVMESKRISEIRLVFRSGLCRVSWEAKLRIASSHHVALLLKPQNINVLTTTDKADRTESPGPR